jgi:hypothetical protein
MSIFLSITHKAGYRALFKIIIIIILREPHWLQLI